VLAHEGDGLLGLRDEGVEAMGSVVSVIDDGLLFFDASASFLKYGANRRPHMYYRRSLIA